MLVCVNCHLKELVIYYQEGESEKLNLQSDYNFSSAIMLTYLALMSHMLHDKKLQHLILPFIFTLNQATIPWELIRPLEEVIFIVGDGLKHYGVLHVTKSECVIYDGFNNELGSLYIQCYISIQAKMCSTVKLTT